MFGDVGVDATQGQLLVRGRGDGLDDQLSVGIRRLGLILEKGGEEISARVISSTFFGKKNTYCSKNKNKGNSMSITLL